MSLLPPSLSPASAKAGPPFPPKHDAIHRSPVRTSEKTPSRDCLENSWTGRIERFLVAQSVEKEAFHPVPRARGITKWNLFRVSRQSLEEDFSEVRAFGAGPSTTSF